MRVSCECARASEKVCDCVCLYVRVCISRVLCDCVCVRVCISRVSSAVPIAQTHSHTRTNPPFLFSDPLLFVRKRTCTRHLFVPTTKSQTRPQPFLHICTHTHTHTYTGFPTGLKYSFMPKVKPDGRPSYLVYPPPSPSNAL